MLDSGFLGVVPYCIYYRWSCAILGLG